jgi:hypothetical protein
VRKIRNLVWIGVLVTVLIAVGFYLMGGPHAFGGPFPPGANGAVRESIKAYDLDEQATRQLIHAWLVSQLFTWKWWSNVGLAVIPWVVWAFVRRRASTHRLLYVGLVILTVGSYLDFFGVTYGFWRYHIEIVPTMPSYLPWDFTMYPVGAMLFFQYAPELSAYLKALLFACISALVTEPLFTLLQFYEPVKWSVVYSLPLHFLTYLVGHWFGTRMAFAPLSRPEWRPPAGKE